MPLPATAVRSSKKGWELLFRTMYNSKDQESVKENLEGKRRKKQKTEVSPRAPLPATAARSGRRRPPPRTPSCTRSALTSPCHVSIHVMSAGRGRRDREPWEDSIDGNGARAWSGRNDGRWCAEDLAPNRLFKICNFALLETAKIS